MTPEQLKASILQYAIQGKLVEQRSEEGTAEEFFREIQIEKNKLIKIGKAKKGKKYADIETEEKPFDIPESWKWVYLQDISNINGGYAFKSTDYTTEGTRVIRISDFNKNGFVNTKIVRHPYKEEFEPYLLQEKDILLCMTGGTVGKSYFVRSIDEHMMTNQRVATIKILGSIQEYVNYVILSPIIQNIIQTSKTSTNDNISMDTINSFLIPLPPFKEVCRIVAKIEDLLPFVDHYATSYEKLKQFNAKFPEDMKKSILQYAIQGKLVEQRPEEGSAEDLYNQIQEEKQKLIKEGKIKKEKSFAKITEDETPFDIPESWKWVRIPEIGSSSLGKTLNKGTDKGREVPYLCSINVYWDGIKLEQLKTAKFSDEDIEKYILKRNDLLVCEGGDIGRSAIWNRDEEMYYQNALHCIRFYGNINPIYFKYCLQLYKVNGILDTASKGMTIKHLVQGSLYSIIFPLPPLEEQHRIVAKIEELLPYCDQLIEKNNCDK